MKFDTKFHPVLQDIIITNFKTEVYRARYHLEQLCHLNITKFIEVANEFNARLDVSALVKDNAIAQMIKISNEDTRDSLHNILW